MWPFEQIFCLKHSVNVTKKGEGDRSTSQQTQKKKLVHQLPRTKQEAENERNVNQLFRGEEKAEKEKQVQKFVLVKREAEKWQENQLPWAERGAKMGKQVLVQRICLSWFHKNLPEPQTSHLWWGILDWFSRGEFADDTTSHHSLAPLPRYVNISSTSVFFRLIVQFMIVPSFFYRFLSLFLFLSLFFPANRPWQLRFVE